jgi:hypothetical protein
MARPKPDLVDGAPVAGPIDAVVGDLGPEAIVPLEDAPGELVKARWVDDNPAGVFNPEQGLIRYGDAFLVTAEQLEQDPRLEPWSEAWRPDQKVLDEIEAFDNPAPAEEA